MTKSQQSWVRSQHPPTQRNLRCSRWISVEYSKLKKKSPCLQKISLSRWKYMCMYIGRIPIWPEARQEWNQSLNPNKNMGPYAGADYNITLCPLQTLCRSWLLHHLMSTPTVDSNTFIMGNPIPEMTLILCQSRLYPPVRDFGFGL